MKNALLSFGIFLMLTASALAQLAVEPFQPITDRYAPEVEYSPMIKMMADIRLKLEQTLNTDSNCVDFKEAAQKVGHHSVYANGNISVRYASTKKEDGLNIHRVTSFDLIDPDDSNSYTRVDFQNYPFVFNMKADEKNPQPIAKPSLEDADLPEAYANLLNLYNESLPSKSLDGVALFIKNKSYYAIATERCMMSFVLDTSQILHRTVLNTQE